MPSLLPTASPDLGAVYVQMLNLDQSSVGALPILVYYIGP